MKCSQLEVLTGSLACLEKGLRVSLVSVVKTWGASPRPVGSLLAVSSDGTFFGSVSGGCVEDDLIHRLQEQPVNKPSLIKYGESEEEKFRFALPCGSVLQLLAEPLDNIAELRKMVCALEKREPLCRITSLLDGSVKIKAYQAGDQPRLDENTWCNVLGPVWRLLLIGAGETSQYLAQIGQMLGYRVSVIDPRPAYREQWPLSDVPLLVGMPDDALLACRPDSRTAIAALSHDPRVDDMALLAALKSEAFYVGALGSRKNNDKRRRRLKEHFDFSEQELKRLHGPIGLKIGSKVPAEIALSVMAEITAKRNQLQKENVQLANKDRPLSAS